MPIDVVIAKTEGITFAQVESYSKYLSPLRRDRIGKKRLDEDKLLSLAAGLLLSSELSRRAGIPVQRLKYTHGGFGKPYLIGSEWQFSLSHTKGAVCAGFSPKEEIGVDIERKSRQISSRLYERVLSPAERDCVRSSEDFIRAWVKKEAFLKRLGTGISGDLRGADTSILRDTAAFDVGDLLAGISCKGAEGANIRIIALEDVLKCFG